MPGVSDKVSGFTLGLSALVLALFFYVVRLERIGVERMSGEMSRHGKDRSGRMRVGGVGTYVRPVERRTPARKADTVERVY
jgi:hypothetical protein